MTVGVRGRSKYGNKKALYKGMLFDSQHERNRHIILEKHLADGKIECLLRQVTFQLTAHGKPICKLILDHGYRLPGGATVFEDSKGMQTDVFRIKQKLFEAQTGQKIHIVKKQNIHDLPEQS